MVCVHVCIQASKSISLDLGGKYVFMRYIFHSLLVVGGERLIVVHSHHILRVVAGFVVVLYVGLRVQNMLQNSPGA